MVYFKYFNPSEKKEHKNKEKTHKGRERMADIKNTCYMSIGHWVQRENGHCIVNYSKRI